MVVFDHERGDIITSNSPVKLVVEGGAKSIRLARNPHVVNGRSICRPHAGVWLGCGCVDVRLLGEGYSRCDAGVIIRAAAAP